MIGESEVSLKLTWWGSLCQIKKPPSHPVEYSFINSDINSGPASRLLIAAVTTSLLLANLNSYRFESSSSVQPYWQARFLQYVVHSSCGAFSLIVYSVRGGLAVSHCLGITSSFRTRTGCDRRLHLHTTITTSCQNRNLF